MKLWIKELRENGNIYYYVLFKTNEAKSHINLKTGGGAYINKEDAYKRANEFLDDIRTLIIDTK